jgi:hypothetical protein
MFWFKLSKYRRLWRLIFLPLLFVAINGPWFFDLMWAPAPYTCLPPNIRLDETFCGGATQSIGPLALPTSARRCGASGSISLPPLPG